jgi:hypothetical protein
MTRQCREVLSSCDFPVTAARDVEPFLARCTVAQVVSLVWGKDPEGKHEASWFAPFFINGYVRSKVSIPCSFDQQFWEAYDWVAQAMPEDFSAFDLPSIDEMARDMKRMRRAVGASKVLTVPYVFKVFQGMEPTREAVSNSTAIGGFEIGSRGAKPRGNA